MYGSLFYVLPILAVIAKTVFRAVLPLLIGCMIAYVVNILMCFYEKGYARICRMAAIAPLQRPLCMTLSYLSLVLVILILWWMIVPQLLSCIRIIATDFPQVLELLCEWANEHLQMDLGMGNEIRAWMNEPFCWDTLIVKIPRLAKGMKTSLEKLGSWLLIFLPGLMFSFLSACCQRIPLTDGQFPDRPVFRCFPREKNTLRTDGSQSVLPSFSGRADHRGRNPRYALYHRHVDSASPLCCHDRLSGRCNRAATGHRSLYRCRSRCVYASYGFPGKSTGISYLFNNSPADRRQFYLSPCGRTFHRAARHLGTCRSHCRRWGIRYLGNPVCRATCSSHLPAAPSLNQLKPCSNAARLLKNKQKSNRAYALCVF